MRVIMPSSPMQIPMVGILAFTVSWIIRMLSENVLAMVAILTMSASSAAIAACSSCNSSGVPLKSWQEPMPRKSTTLDPRIDQPGCVSMPLNSEMNRESRPDRCTDRCWWRWAIRSCLNLVAKSFTEATCDQVGRHFDPDENATGQFDGGAGHRRCGWLGRSVLGIEWISLDCRSRHTHRPKADRGRFGLLRHLANRSLPLVEGRL